MTPTEVFAVEIRQYLADGKQLLQASLVGQTSKAREIKTGRKLQVSALPALVDQGALKDGDHLWVMRDKIRSDLRPTAPDDPRLRFTLVVEGGDINVRYEAGDAPEVMKASQALARARRQLGRDEQSPAQPPSENLSIPTVRASRTSRAISESGRRRWRDQRCSGLGLLRVTARPEATRGTRRRRTAGRACGR